jgi:hypothetical protein
MENNQKFGKKIIVKPTIISGTPKTIPNPKIEIIDKEDINPNITRIAPINCI